jgi:hypothetical protein
MATTDVILPSIQYDNVRFADAVSTANLFFANNAIYSSGSQMIFNNGVCIVGFPRLEINVTIAGCNVVNVNVDSSRVASTENDTFMMTHLYKYFSLGEPRQTLTPNSSRYTKFPDEP